MFGAAQCYGMANEGLSELVWRVGNDMTGGCFLLHQEVHAGPAVPIIIEVGADDIVVSSLECFRQCAIAGCRFPYLAVELDPAEQGPRGMSRRRIPIIFLT